MRSPTTPLSVGIAIGAGTGPELADVFERAAQTWAAERSSAVAFERCPHQFRTFGPIARGSVVDADRVMREDADRYAAFLRSLYCRGSRIVFRTAFNAQSLYRVREELLAAKVDVLPTATGEILLVRDASQGFYAGENLIDEDEDVIRRVCTFRRATTDRVLDFALREATARYGSVAALDRAVVACKFHLLGPQFARWIADYSRRSGVPFDLWQPDTTNRNLLRGELRGRVLIVGANEWADVMASDLMLRAGLGSQEECCSRVAYLEESVRGLAEVQTAHGSADDLSGKDVVNPAATLRAAALALEYGGMVPGLMARVGHAIAAVTSGGCCTPDAGGISSTTAVVDQVLAAVAATAPSIAIADLR